MSATELIAYLKSQKSATNNATNLEIDEICHIIHELEPKLQNQYVQHNAIFVLGNTGSGKTTFIKWITDNDATLESKEDPVNLDEYFIDDNSEKSKLRFTSNTLSPEVITDKETDTIFYDFPGFLSTKGIFYDIATTFFIKKTVEDIKSIKIVFLVKDALLRNDQFTNHFKDFTRNAVMVMKNFDKFQDSVLLLVSKVSTYNGKFSYDEIVNSLVISMQNAKRGLQKEMDRTNVDNSMSIQFIDAILRKNGNVYPHIQLFWSPDKKGPLSEIPLMLDNKRDITAALKKIAYAHKDIDDFGYFIPKRSFADVGNLLKEVHRYILEGIRNFGRQVQESFYNQENRLYDIVRLYNETASAYDKLITSKTAANKLKRPQQCVRRIVGDTALRSDDVKLQNLKNITLSATYSSFFYTVSHYPMNESFKCADGLDDAIEYADKSRKWYKFLVELHDNALSTYDVQKNINAGPCNELATFVIEGGKANENKSSSVLEPFVKKCDPKREYEFKATTMNKPKLNALQNLLNLTMNHRVDFSCNSSRLLVKGHYVKLSDVNSYAAKCKQKPAFIHVFVAHRLFFDQDLESTAGIGLSLLAREWHVLGFRKIDVRGDSAVANGNFFGIGDHFINLPNLQILSVGGNNVPQPRAAPSGVITFIPTSFSDEIESLFKSEPVHKNQELNNAIVLNEYKAYLRDNMYHNVREFQQKEFLDKIESSKITRKVTKPKRHITKKSVASQGRNENADVLFEGADPDAEYDNGNRIVLQENVDYATNAARNLYSPMNTAMNVIAGFFVPLEFIYPSIFTSYGYNSIKSGIESTFEESTTSQSNAHFITKNPNEFSVYGAIALADLFIRSFTKVKPYDRTEKPINLFEVRASTLNIIAEFQTVLSRSTGESNLSDQSIEFDPITLISKLDKKLINRDYQNLTRILFESVENKALLDYANFEKNMQSKIDQILAKQGENIRGGYCASVDDVCHDTNRICNVLGAQFDYSHISHCPNPQEIY